MPEPSLPDAIDPVAERRRAVVGSVVRLFAAFSVFGAVAGISQATDLPVAIGVWSILFSLIGSAAWLTSRGHSQLTAQILVIGLSVVGTLLHVLMAQVGGTHAALAIFVVLLSRMLLGVRWMVGALAYHLVTLTLFATLGYLGVLPPLMIQSNQVDQWSAGVVLLSLAGLLAHLMAEHLESAARDAVLAAQTQEMHAAQSRAIAALMQKAHASNDTQELIGEVISAIRELGAPHVALLRGDADALQCLGGDLPGGGADDLAAFRAATDDRSGVRPAAQRIAAFGPTQVMARVGEESPAQALWAGFDSEERARTAVNFLQTAAGMLSTAYRRDRIKESAIQAQKFDAAARLAGNVGHEFNNLLTTILGEVAVVNDASDSATREAGARIASAVARGGVLTGRLLAVARRHVVVRERVDFASVVRRFVDDLPRWVPTRVVASVVAPEQPVWVRMDRTELDLLLYALVHNAVQAMPGGGRLSIRVGLDDAGYALLRVEDEGVGMSSDVLARVFEPFFSTRPDGTGLSLSTLRTSLERDGGSLSIDSTVGHGTTVTVRIPRLVEDVDAPASRRVTPVYDGPPTILVVDDEALVRRVTLRALSRAGFRVLEAVDGQDALDMLAGHGEISVVVTDAVMPRLGGVDLARRVRRDLGLPVILVSGYTRDLGGLDESVAFLPKPYEPRVLVNLVRKVLGEPESTPGPLPPA